MTQLERMIFNAVSERQQMNRAAKKSPDFATMPEIMNSLAVEVKESINRLVNDNLLEWHQNINGVRMFGIKDN